MFKKIISLMLVACMVLALGVTVSAANEPTVYLQLEENPAVAGQFFVFAAVKDNVAVVDADGNGSITDAEKNGLFAYQLILDYNKDKFNLVNIIKEGTYQGGLTANPNTAAAVWTEAGGLYTSVLNQTTYINDITGLTDTKLVRFIFTVKSNAITEEDYGESFDFKFTTESNAALTSTAGNSDCTLDRTAVQYTIADTREPIAGLTATPVEGLAYTGEVIDPATTVTLNTADGDVVTYKSEPAEIKAAGTYKVTATVKRAGCKATDVSADVVVAPKAITATVANATKVYGDADPTFTATAEGLVGEDTLTYEFARAEGEDVGKYAINATATNPNYAVTVTAGELEITKKAINVTMADASMTYGDALPAFTSDAPNGVTITPTVEAKPNAGTVAITATAESANYDVTVVPGTLTVAPKAATITVQNEFQVLGNGKLATFKVPVVEGLVGEDTIEDIVVDFAAATPWDEVEGDYTLTATYTANPNYTVTVVDGVYSVKSAIPVVITFGENKKTYGDADGDIVVSGDVELVTIVRKDNEDAGAYTDAYEVTLIADEDPTGLPYALNVSNNVFVIDPKAATITVADAIKKVEDVDPAFTFTAEGFLDGEAPETVEFSRATGETAGEYAITATYVDPNYAITVVDGTLSISKYDAKVTAPTTVVYVGKSVPALIATVEGEAVEGEITATVEIYDETNALVSTVDTSVEATYTTKATATYNADKYDVELVEGTLTVRKASGRPSGGGTVVKPATGGSTGGSTKPSDDNKEASANIAMKENASSIKFIEGFEDKTFRPDTNATRNDVVAALAALFDITDVKNAPAFTDTDDKTVKALAAAGVIDGYEDGSFKGYNDVTRAEFVKLLAAALKLEVVEGAEANFSDIEGHWAAEWIKTFVSKGYIVGYPDGTFRPDANITRAEMVVVITRVAGTVDAENAINFADVTEEHWAYDYIMKAAK